MIILSSEAVLEEEGIGKTLYWEERLILKGYELRKVVAEKEVVKERRERGGQRKEIFCEGGGLRKAMGWDRRQAEKKGGLKKGVASKMRLAGKGGRGAKDEV